jgi:AmpE protein
VLNGYAQKHALGLQHTTQKILLVVEWVPVRLAAVGFLIVGHFSRALPVWLSLCFDTSTCAKDVLTRVAIAAEDVQSEPDDLVTEAVTLVSLAKRNILFILSIVAILTLLGVIQ